MNIWHPLALLAAIPLVACNSAQGDWQKANASNTLAGYQDFLQKHPNTPQSAEARSRIEAQEDEGAWAWAQQVGTIAAFESYIAQQPGGRHVDEAKDRIASNERMKAWVAASATDTPEALQAFLDKYPGSPQAKQARAKLAQMTGYRVQFAAYHSETQAEKLRDHLQGKYGDLLGSVVVVPEAGSNAHLLRSAPMGEVEANNACAKLKKDHQACEVVRDVNS